MITWMEIAKKQPLASKVIMNSIRKDRVSHAYLIQGERGTGKEAIALLLAKGLFCQNKNAVEPCHRCNTCKRITSGNHPDIHWIRPANQSIRMEQIEKLQKEFTYLGLESSQKVYIISHADTMTLNAANRILKFLEEPSKRSTAIMLTENSQSIIPTIRSRCQVIDLQPLNQSQLQEQLMDSGVTEEQAIFLSALTNNIEEALLWHGSKWFAQARKIVIQLVNMYVSDPEEIYLFIHKHWIPHFKERKQLEQGLDFLLLAFKDILYYHIDYKEALTFFTSQTDTLKLEHAILYFSQEKLIEILNLILKAKRKLKQNVHPTLVMEQLTLQI